MKSLKSDEIPDNAEALRHRLAPPSSGLQARILVAARRAWEESDAVEDEVSWVFPVLRLAASLVLAVGLVCAADWLGSRSQSPSILPLPAPVAVNVPGVRAEEIGMWRLVGTATPLPMEDVAGSIRKRMMQMNRMMQNGSDSNG